MQDLDEDTRDALAEAFNLALGHAALHFSELVAQEVEFSVPEVALLPFSELAARVETRSALAGQGRLYSISQGFRSTGGEIEIQGRVILSEQGSLALLRQVMPDGCGAGLGTLEQEALIELGNLILNSCMNRLADVFAREMTGSLPRLRGGTAKDLLGGPPAGERTVLWTGVGLQLAGRDIHSQVVFLMEPAALAQAIRRVRLYFGVAQAAA